ncbi:MAG: SPOR domain-containing protein [Shinella sp.]|nr:SPOR domain-containing protein [Shinella sp.]
MADKNFARSGTADTDLLADDDPLSELARIVGYEPRPTQPVQIVRDPDQYPPQRNEPIFALEDELMREFELYDAPNLDPVEHVSAPEIKPPAEEPAAHEAEAAEFHAGPETLDYQPAFRDEGLSDEAARDDAAIEDGIALEVRSDDFPPEFASVEPETADHAPAMPESEEAADIEPPVVSGYQADIGSKDHSRPRFEEEAVESDRREPVFLGLQPADASDDPLASAADDLERELELSIGDELFAGSPEVQFEPTHTDEYNEAASFTADAAGSEPGLAPEQTDAYVPEIEADAAVSAALPAHAAAAAHDENPPALWSQLEPMPADAFFVEEQTASSELSESDAEPGISAWPDDFQAVSDRTGNEPFLVEPAYTDAEPHFAAEPVHSAESGEIAQSWIPQNADGRDAGFQPEETYEVAPAAATNDAYDLDDLLAEVERFPVPPAHLPSEADAGEGPRESWRGQSSVPFGRATPVAFRSTPAPASTVFAPEPVPQPPAEKPIAEAPAAAAKKPEPEFDSFEIDLSDMDLNLDPADFGIEDKPAAPPVAERRDPPAPASVVAPVQAAAVPVEEKADDSVLPFDPAMIADTEESVAPVTNLNVPQLPTVEKEKPAYQPDYDLDIDAEMAQLFATPVNGGSQSQAASNGAAPSLASTQNASDGDGALDEFERALEEDFRRSLNQPERAAIPVDPHQSGQEYVNGADDDGERRGKGMLIAAAAAVVFLLGGAGVYAWMSGTGTGLGSGEPRIIMADKDPVKVVPEEKGGKTVPNQDKAVYDRVAGSSEATPQQEQLVTTTEEPVDVVQRTLTPEALPMDSPEEDVASTGDDDDRLLPGVDDPAANNTGDDRTPVVSPRKVRTMIVKPDGTLVAREETVTQPETEVAAADPQTPPGSRLAAPAMDEALPPAAGQTDISAPAGGETPLSAEPGTSVPPSGETAPANGNADGNAPVRVVKTTTIGANAEAPANAGNTPVPVSRPVDQPVTVVGTVTERGNVRDGEGQQTARAEPAPAAQAPAAEPATANPGGYVIQIASLPSEAEAQKSYDSLSSRFANVIGGRGVDIRRADIAGRGTYFRVRIPAGSREEANALCSRYKSAGGSCLVTR